jgi:tRNA-Thr(GGU) m(6)t(6)A37 methyltransferase TsaA
MSCHRRFPSLSTDNQKIPYMPYKIEPIGYVKTTRLHAEDDYWGNEQASINLTDSFSSDALQGLDEFSHVEVIFIFHEVLDSKIVTGARHPRNNPAWPAVGIFAQRGKNRPNRIGSTICRVISVEGTSLIVAELDAIDGTPVVDIKPVMQEFLPRDSIMQPAWSKEIMSNYWLPRSIGIE